MKNSNQTPDRYYNPNMIGNTIGILPMFDTSQTNLFLLQHLMKRTQKH
uniref:Bm355 n=1 Tax=Brugia malayi TaxID=6279 RepID=A0A0J9XR80_BRUMA|nr:Bm355 [Brugia malayi]